MDLARVTEEISEVIASSEMKWSRGPPVPEHPQAHHYIGNHHDWVVQLMVYGDVVDGAAVNMKRCIVLHLMPGQASKARELALKAVA